MDDDDDSVTVTISRKALEAAIDASRFCGRLRTVAPDARHRYAGASSELRAQYEAIRLEETQWM